MRRLAFALVGVLAFVGFLVSAAPVAAQSGCIEGPGEKCVQVTWTVRIVGDPPITLAVINAKETGPTGKWACAPGNPFDCWWDCTPKHDQKVIAGYYAFEGTFTPPDSTKWGLVDDSGFSNKFKPQAELSSDGTESHALVNNSVNNLICLSFVKARLDSPANLLSFSMELGPAPPDTDLSNNDLHGDWTDITLPKLQQSSVTKDLPYGGTFVAEASWGIGAGPVYANARYLLKTPLLQTYTTWLKYGERGPTCGFDPPNPDDPNPGYIGVDGLHYFKVTVQDADHGLNTLAWTPDTYCTINHVPDACATITWVPWPFTPGTRDPVTVTVKENPGAAYPGPGYYGATLIAVDSSGNSAHCAKYVDLTPPLCLWTRPDGYQCSPYQCTGPVQDAGFLHSGLQSIALDTAKSSNCALSPVTFDPGTTDRVNVTMNRVDILTARWSCTVNVTDVTGNSQFCEAYIPVIRTPRAIDIKPGDSLNVISLGARGALEVAILSDADFHAPSQVASRTLIFGHTGDEKSLLTRKNGDADCGTRDVNGDGRIDLVCRFLVKLTGVQVGDTVGILRGVTVAGIPFEGRDAVNVVP